MFGRKQPAFTLAKRQMDAHEELAPPSPTVPPVVPHVQPGEAHAQGPEHIELPFGEAAPDAVAPIQRPTTPRPDPLSLFPSEGQVDPRHARVASPLLQLGAEETIGDGPAPTEPKRRAGRTKTRLLGIDHGEGQVEDVLARQAAQIASAPVTYHAVGWLVIVDGPGRGHSMPLRSGVSQLGRGDDQSIQLDFGDTSISRDNHASLAFDEEQRAFFIGHGGKANLVRLNNAPVLTTEKLVHGDQIRIGETTVQLVAFCGEDFVWAQEANQADASVSPAQEDVPADAPLAVAAPAPQTAQNEGHA